MFTARTAATNGQKFIAVTSPNPPCQSLRRQTTSRTAAPRPSGQVCEATRGVFLDAAAGISSHSVWRVVAIPHTRTHAASLASFYDFLPSEHAAADCCAVTPRVELPRDCPAAAQDARSRAGNVRNDPRFGPYIRRRICRTPCSGEPNAGDKVVGSSQSTHQLHQNFGQTRCPKPLRLNLPRAAARCLRNVRFDPCLL